MDRGWPQAGDVATGIADRWTNPFWFGTTLVGAIVVAFIVSLTRVHGHDALAYWLVDPADPYALRSSGLTGSGVFRYSPTVALLFAPLRHLPWRVFTTVWLAAQLGVLWLLAGRWWLALVLLPPVTLDLFAGNIDVFLALLVALSFRHPGAWALVGLTKVTPIMGAMWFVGRRDWRGLAWVIVVMGVLVAARGITGVQAMVRLDARSLGESAWQTPAGLYLPISTLPRVLAAAAIAYYAGATNRRWLVPIAVVVAMPTLWIIAFAPLIAAGA